MTQSVTRARIERLLFSRIGSKVSFIQNGLVCEFATDPEWNRVLVGLKDDYISHYTNTSGPGGEGTVRLAWRDCGSEPRYSFESSE